VGNRPPTGTDLGGLVGRRLTTALSRGGLIDHHHPITGAVGRRSTTNTKLWGGDPPQAHRYEGLWGGDPPQTPICGGATHHEHHIMRASVGRRSTTYSTTGTTKRVTTAAWDTHTAVTVPQLHATQTAHSMHYRLYNHHNNHMYMLSILHVYCTTWSPLSFKHGCVCPHLHLLLTIRCSVSNPNDISLLIMQHCACSFVSSNSIT